MSEHSHIPSAGARHKGRLWFVLALTGAFTLAEVVGGILTNSLALLADAAHMATDVLGIALALVAIWLGAKPPDDRKTFGYYRAEILAAMVNGGILIAVGIYVLMEAYQRFRNPPQIVGGWMLLVAVIGLVVNVAGMLILRRGAGESLNVRGAYLEVFGDMLGSLGVIAAAVIVMWTGWEQADPLIAAVIGLFIVPRAWRLMRQSVDVLMEATPADLELPELRRALESVPGVASVHDLHAWTITSGMNAVSAHLVLRDDANASTVLVDAQRLLHERFNIGHSTLQLERGGHAEAAAVHR